MNKVRLNNKIHNHISIMTCDFQKDFEDVIEEQEWAESIWNHIINDELERHVCYVKNKAGLNKHMITLWTDEEWCYLIVAFRTEWNTTKTNVYMISKTDSNISDFKAVGKFIHYNINSINKGYKEMILDARDHLVKNNIHIEDDDEREEHSELN